MLEIIFYIPFSNIETGRLNYERGKLIKFSYFVSRVSLTLKLELGHDSLKSEGACVLLAV